MPVVTDYTALLSGDYWNGIEVTGKPVVVTYGHLEKWRCASRCASL